MTLREPLRTAYPLAWPPGWPEHKSEARESDSRFYGAKYGLTTARARDSLFDELRKLGAADVVVSSNLPLRRDGTPTGDDGLLRGSPGVAVYFRIAKRPLVMAQDSYRTVAGNLRSLALAVEAMRQLERHGGGEFRERAFTGFLAIAPPSWKKPWREVFGVDVGWKGDLAQRYRYLATLRHPDKNNGSDQLMAELNVAYEEAKKEHART